MPMLNHVSQILKTTLNEPVNNSTSQKEMHSIFAHVLQVHATTTSTPNFPKAKSSFGSKTNLNSSFNTIIAQ